MPTTYATAFAAHHARGFTLRPRDTTFRPRDTMVHHPTMLRPRDTTFRRGDTMVRHQPTTTKTRSTQSLGDFSASDRCRAQPGSRRLSPECSDLWAMPYPSSTIRFTK